MRGRCGNRSQGAIVPRVNRRAVVGAVGVVALFGLSVLSYLSPNLTLKKLREAASKPDVDELRELAAAGYARGTGRSRRLSGRWSATSGLLVSHRRA